MKRILVAAVSMTVALMSAESAALAAPIPFDQTIAVPGEIVPAAFVCVNDTCQEVEGIQDLSIRIQATAVIADNTKVTATGANCKRVDQKISLNLASGATGEVSISYHTLDAESGNKSATPTVHKIPFAQGVTGTPSPVIQACVR